MLKGSTLNYYKSPKNTTPNGQIPLQSIYTVTLLRDKKMEPSQPYSCSLILRTELRDFVMCGPSVIELDEWREAIQVASGQQHQHDLALNPSVGKLFVVILGAENLMPNNVGGEASMRPYCVASLAKQKYETQAHAGSNPVYENHVLEFNLNSIFNPLQITVWDDQANLAPRYLGQVSLSIDKLLQYRSPVSLWYALQKRTQISVISGSINLLIYYNEKDEAIDACAGKINMMMSRTGLQKSTTRSNTNPAFPDTVLKLAVDPKSQSEGGLPMAKMALKKHSNRVSTNDISEEEEAEV